METGTLLLIVIGLFGLMLVCVLVGAWFLLGSLNPEPSRVQARLKSVVTVRTQRDDNFTQWLNQQTQGGEINAGPLTGVLNQLSEKLTLSARLRRAGVVMAPTRFLLLFMVAPVVFGLVSLNTKVLPIIPSILIVLSPMAVLLLLSVKAKKRYEKLEQQLPDALSILSASLRAGHAFAAGTQIMAEQLPPPIKPIFEDIHNDLKLGVPVKESLTKMLQSVEVVDFRIFATAILVQRESGGNLAEIMDQLSTTIRERAKLKRQISVLTSQPRLSAYIIGAAPAIMYIVIQFLMPGYTQVLENHQFGPFIIGFVIAMQVLGFLVMRRIVAIRI